VNVENCNFIGVQWDKSAVETVTIIAEALLENAKALRNLSAVLKESNVHIDAMLRVGGAVNK
jgi:hypothetical protein